MAKKDNTVLILGAIALGFLYMNPGILGGGSGSGGGTGFIILPGGQRIPVSQAQQYGYVYYAGSANAPAGWYHTSQFPSPQGTTTNPGAQTNNPAWVNTLQGILNTAGSLFAAGTTIYNTIAQNNQTAQPPTSSLPPAGAQTVALPGSTGNWQAPTYTWP